MWIILNKFKNYSLQDLICYIYILARKHKLHYDINNSKYRGNLR